MRKYDCFPEIKIKKYSGAWQGYKDIVKVVSEKISTINKTHTIVSIECYPGVNHNEINELLIKNLNADKIVFSDEIAMTGNEITEMVKRNLTDDRVFGVMSHHTLEEFFSNEKIDSLNKEIMSTNGLTVIYGTGAALIAKADILIYADLTRWEIQCRYRKGMGNWKTENSHDDILRKYKRGYFFEWRVADRHKMNYFSDIDFLLDTNTESNPKMVTGEDYRNGLKEVVSQPFRVVPYFDASIWGGQWMKENFQLDPSADNFGWAFDGVPEENSLLMKFGNVRVETPSLNVVHQYPNELLGEKVHSRFGREFPIRFDYLDTMGGGNLSLQVHPLVEYIQDKFGMHYTQDESYYILDAKEDATVYLGVKEGTKLDNMMDDLEKAEKGNYRFPDEKYINQFSAKKHDHFLIPAGTVHCGGGNAVVLEISATPYIFTFKLWDWERVGLDGKPRPVHLEHGHKNIQINRNKEWVENNLINQFSTLMEDKNRKTERTGLNELEFIETHRHWFIDKIAIETHESVNMLNLVEGDEAIIESIDGGFEPFMVHYGETFIIPAQLKKYTIRAANPVENKEYAVIQAFVRNL